MKNVIVEILPEQAALCDQALQAALNIIPNLANAKQVNKLINTEVNTILLETVTLNENGYRDPKGDFTFQYVNIEETLKLLLKDPSFNATQKHDKSFKPYLNKVRDGARFQTTVFSEEVSTFIYRGGGGGINLNKST